MTPLRISSRLAPSTMSSLVSQWTPLTLSFTTRHSTGSSTLVTSGLTSLCLTRPGTPVKVSRFPPLLFSSPPLLLLLPLLRYTSPPLVQPRQSPQQPSALLRHVIVHSGGVGAGGAATEGTRSGGALLRGARAEAASLGGARVGGASAGV
ncbi:unnamed protein product [Closterium sp. NIES-54]